MDHKKKNAMRNALTQMTGVLTDNAMSDLIMAYDLPAGLTVKIAQAVIRGSMQGVMQNCYDDVIKRQLSSREVQKHLLVFDIAEKTFMELAINDNIDHIAIMMDDSSAGIQIKRLTPTKYTKTVCDALMLEKLSDDDIKRTIESLAISDEGEPAKGLTEEEFVASNSWEYVESEEGINVGGRYKSVRDTAILSEDTTHLSQGKDFMNQAARNVDMGYLLDGINSVMSAIGLFKKCKTEAIYQPAIEDALKILADYFEYCNDHGGLRILRGKRLDYETILADISGEHISECRDYLKLAKEEDISFDVRLNEQDSKKMVEDAINKAEREMKEKK
jgi:hypothetical protein